jgi:hypothetical protein
MSRIVIGFIRVFVAVAVIILATRYVHSKAWMFVVLTAGAFCYALFDTFSPWGNRFKWPKGGEKE